MNLKLKRKAYLWISNNYIIFLKNEILNYDANKRYLALLDDNTLILIYDITKEKEDKLSNNIHCKIETEFKVFDLKLNYKYLRIILIAASNNVGIIRNSRNALSRGN